MKNTRTVEQEALSLSSRPYWLASTPQTDYPAIEEDVTVDVAVIGGGLAGISTAYLLKQEGLRVAVVEAARIAARTTGHTTAKITSQHGLYYKTLLKQAGEEKARQYAEANEAAIRFIANLVQEKKIACDFRWAPAHVYTRQNRYVKPIAAEVEAANKLGIKAEYVDQIPLPLPTKAAVRFDGQAEFHPRKYVLALAKEIPGSGSYIFEQTLATDIDGKQPYIVHTNRGKKITARRVVIASHYPCFDDFGKYYLRIYQSRSYVVAVRIAETFPDATFISAESPTRSLRAAPSDEGQLVLISGEHHKTGHGENLEKHYGNLARFAAGVFAVQEVLYRWSTQDCTTVDNIPYIGRLTAATPDLYVATGFRKWGMTNSTVAALLIRDLIVRGESAWAPVYDPARSAIKGAKELFVQNADVANQFVSGKLKLGAEKDEPNRGGQRVGAYRDEEGTLYLVDSTCTHLGCELQWNDAEKTWDCPCHGSRFGYDGRVVEGPALRPLQVLPGEGTDGRQEEKEREMAGTGAKERR